MPTVAVHNASGQEVGQMDLAAGIFETGVSTNCVRAVVNRQMARARQGSACTKNRALIRGSNAKPWRQKGTGRARAGTRKSPIWRGGGTIFGPTPRQYGGRINRKVVRRAIFSCLSSFAQEGLMVVDELKFDKPKTKQMTEVLKSLKLEDLKVLILTDSTDFNVALSARNLSRVNVINCDNLNTLDLTTHDILLATSAAIKRLEEMYA